jgi:hypothetical protein
MHNTAVCDEHRIDSSFLYKPKYPFLISAIACGPSVVMDRSVWNGSFISEATPFEGMINIFISRFVIQKNNCKNFSFLELSLKTITANWAIAVPSVDNSNHGE